MYLPDEVKMDQEELNIKIKTEFCGQNIIALETVMFAFKGCSNPKIYRLEAQANSQVTQEI